MGRHNRRAGGRAEPRVRVASRARVLQALEELVLHAPRRDHSAALRAAAWLRIRLPRV